MKKNGKIAREELIKQTQNALKSCRVENKTKSKYANEVSKAICGTKKPIFSRMQPTIKQETSQEWLEAYAFVISFLRQNKCENTIDCIKRELQTCGVNVELNKSPKYNFNTLKNIKRESFQAKVKKFTEKLEKQQSETHEQHSVDPLQRQQITPVPQPAKKEEQKEYSDDISFDDDIEISDDNEPQQQQNVAQNASDDSFDFSDDAFDVEVPDPRQNKIQSFGFDTNSIDLGSTDPFAASGSFA